MAQNRWTKARFASHNIDPPEIDIKCRIKRRVRTGGDRPRNANRRGTPAHTEGAIMNAPAFLRRRARHSGRIPVLLSRAARGLSESAGADLCGAASRSRSLGRLVKDNQAAIVAAINADYGNRSAFETTFGEVFSVLDGIHDATQAPRRLDEAAPAERRSLTFPGARNRVIPQPLGVVGVIVPWNFPLQLSVSPLVSIFAAGNRAMVKMSENSQRLAELLIEIAPKYFPADKLAFFDDGGGRGAGVLVAAVRPSDLHRLRRQRAAR